MQRHGGRLEAVVNGKILNEQQRKCMVMDLERGVSDRIEPLPWQTDTCIGNWHYDINLFHRHGYKSADQVAHMLVDIVSKNGNLMLNIPLPGSGMPDTDELAFPGGLHQVDGRQQRGHLRDPPLARLRRRPRRRRPGHPRAGLQRGQPHYTSQDFRFTQKGDALYAFALAWPEDGKLVVRSLAQGAGKVQDVRLLGYPGKLDWTQTDGGPGRHHAGAEAVRLRLRPQIAGRNLTPVVIAPAPIQPQANGAIVLNASDADLHGGSPQIETKNGLDDVGYWNAPADFVSWDFAAPGAGNYSVSVSYACDPGSAGEGFTVEVGGQTLAGTATSTGGWDTFADQPLGKLTLAGAGKQTLAFKPGAGWKGIALRSVSLTKAP